MLHQLKCRKEYFTAMVEGKKSFEVRKNDRDFRIGDYLALNEIDGLNQNNETGRFVVAEIVYMLNEKEFTKDEMVILGISPCFIEKNLYDILYTVQGDYKSIKKQEIKK